MDSYWESPNGHGPHPVKYESEAAVAGFTYCAENGLNFSTAATTYSEDDAEYNHGKRGKTSRQDPLSHRIIEKRRRDRMNSCLNDLSRLIPPQYLRKGRGRVEKTEIIEMAIRHMKHLQNQEYISKETICAEQFKQGYQECLSEAAKFLLKGHLKDLCCQMVEHLKDHCSEIMKGDILKARPNIDSIRASSGSPNGFHHSAPLSQLRDMVPSDVEHNSNSTDNNDVKDLSFRSQPQQAAVITSTAPLVHHLDSTNSDLESVRESSMHPEPNHLHESVLRTTRLRKFSETSTDIEHHNNIKYKFKNSIQQRFSQDNHLHHDISNLNGCSAYNSDHNEDTIRVENNIKKRKVIPPDSVEYSSCDEKPTTNGITMNGISEIKSELPANLQMNSKSRPIFGMNGINHSLAVPIFALHAQGTYYVPLNIEYESLIPYLGGIDLLEKNCNSIPPLHPININVCFSNAIIKNFARPKLENMSNGW